MVGGLGFLGLRIARFRPYTSSWSSTACFGKAAPARGSRFETEPKTPNHYTRNSLTKGLNTLAPKGLTLLNGVLNLFTQKGSSLPSQSFTLNYQRHSPSRTAEGPPPSEGETPEAKTLSRKVLLSKRSLFCLASNTLMSYSCFEGQYLIVKGSALLIGA